MSYHCELFGWFKTRRLSTPEPERKIVSLQDKFKPKSNEAKVGFLGKGLGNVVPTIGAGADAEF